MNRKWWLVALLGALAAAVGCVNVKAPERIEVGGGRAQPVDASRLPATSSHEECRAELERAYAYIQDLERQNARLEEKAEKYKRERDEQKKRDKHDD